jgi:monoamine oxidase
MNSVPTGVSVAIVGGGLAGLCAARLLHAAQVDCVVLEARDRLGGRILTVDAAGEPTDDGVDLGPSWFWPHMQPAIADLIAELQLPAFGQHSDGDVVFERMSREGPQRYHGGSDEPLSFRLAGGTGALVAALARDLPPDSVRLRATVTGMMFDAAGVQLTVTDRDGRSSTLSARHVIAALPPRLLAESVDFTPAMDDRTLRRWRGTPTWMAPHAKFFALYDRAFWREAGCSGTAQSMVGPMPEIHDATTASGQAALFGFVGVGADQRAALGDAALTRACLEQLARLFGPAALHPTATLLKDWAADALTATAADRVATGHPVPDAAPWVTGAWKSVLTLGGSETSPSEPGYLAGAVVAAGRAVDEVLHQQHRWGRSS